ncbi:hypothetical protein AA103587_2545 [Gluconobacter kanchanaburiensis NBRC 103587]|nr:hypothetical protein AA103587_2545 [Gluconobacter kanchanaburiensis NBRC 103587]
MTNPRRGELLEKRGSKPPCPDHEHGRFSQSFLPRAADLREQDLP